VALCKATKKAPKGAVPDGVDSSRGVT